MLKFLFRAGTMILFSWFSFTCQSPNQEFINAFEFITAADMRYYVSNVDTNTRHFMGALEAIKLQGAGSFLVSTGDIDPPGEVRSAIDSILGQDYPWYPVIGNDEIEGEEHVEFLRNYARNKQNLPYLIRYGPAGCEETTFSFEWENCHFVVLNQYYDGKSDMGTDGDVVPELLEWLEVDLAENQKNFIFVFGHEPIFPMPDMETGRIRHDDNSLNKYMDNNIAFIQLLNKYEVTAYICGHTHNTSYSMFNGLWQIDTGHSRGLEGISPGVYFSKVMTGIQVNMTEGKNLSEASRQFYLNNPNQKDLRKGLEYMNLSGGLGYKELNEDQASRGLEKFYSDMQGGETAQQKLEALFWKNANYAASTFIKFYIGRYKVKAEIYRDDGRGGKYSLKKTLILNP